MQASPLRSAADAGPPRAAGAVIPWHRRLGARVLLAVTLVAAASLAAIFFASSLSIERYSLDRSAADLQGARAAFNRLVDSRARFASAMTRLVAELPIFRALINATGLTTDVATLERMAEDYRGKLGADFSVVTDARGAWLAQPGLTRDGTLAPAVAMMIQTARGGRAAREMVSLPEGLYIVVSEPAMFAEEVLGTMTAGYRLDDRVAQELSLVAHCEVNLVCSDGRLCGSSLDAGTRSALIETLARDRARLGQMDDKPQVRQIGAASYVSGVYPLLPDSGRRDSGQLILMQAWQPTEQAIARMRSTLGWVSLGTLAIALGGSLFFSQRLTRPLRRLAEVANEIAAGQGSGHVPVDGPAEARQMATAFNDMTRTLSHWYREAASRSEQLQDAYDRFRAVTESANDAIVSVDGDGRIVFWNRRAALVFGYTEQEALGQTFTMLVPERHLQDGDDLRRSLAEGEDRWIGHTIEVMGRTRDGRETPLELSLSTWKSGPDVFYTGIIRDITDRRHAEATLRQREEQLRQSQKMEAIGRLAGGIAHDFNNLLTAILGYADFLIEDVPAPSKGDVEGIRRAGRSAAALTRQLLAFSRRQVLQPVVLDLNATISGTEKLLRRLIGVDVELALTLEPSLPRVTGDPGQIEQVMLNLAVNARDAMPDGGRLTIATSVGEVAADTMHGGMPVKAGPYVIITVTDTGSGMTDDVRSRIFEPFFTTKGVGRGTGLGLATVFGIVQQSDGYIDVQSAPGRGTTFRIGLPATSSPQTESVVPEARPAAMLRGTETVLLVEDNESVRGLAAEALGRAGYRVLEAENGEHGLRLVSENADRIDLVITDIVMPLMGGRDLASRLRALRPDLKIIFTSGYTDDEIVREDVLQSSAFLQKPFTPDVLGQIVRRVLDVA